MCVRGWGGGEGVKEYVKLGNYFPLPHHPEKMKLICGKRELKSPGKKIPPTSLEMSVGTREKH